jgi:hypothetical protein
MSKYYLVLEYKEGIPCYSETEIVAASLAEVLFIIAINKLEFIEIHKGILI